VRTLAWRFSRPGFAYRTFQLLDWRGTSRGYVVVAIREGRAALVDLQVASESDGTLVDLLAAVQERLGAVAADRMVLRSPSEDSSPPVSRASSRSCPSRRTPSS
jgi:hypothetical protein